jgi:hypothetical protein
VRQSLHAAIGVCAWGAFAALWAWQLNGYLPNQWLDGLFLIAFALVAYAVATPLWVMWNRNIYRRRHNRLAPTICQVSFTTDRLGRQLVIAPAIGRNSNRITIDLDEANGAKHYAAPDPEAEPPAAQEIGRVA